MGLVVASADLVFLNYVVPHFLQKTERAVVRDLGSLIVSQITHQERFQYDKYVVTANDAELLPSNDPNTSLVKLHGMAMTILDKGKPTAIGVAQEATLAIHTNPATDSAEIDISLVNGTGFDPGNAFRKVAGSLQPMTLPVPSYFKSKPKFLNLKMLRELSVNPWTFPTVADAVQKIQTVYTYDMVGGNIVQQFERLGAAGGTGGVRAGRAVITFDQRATGTDKEIIIIDAAAAARNADTPERPVTFSGKPGAPIRIEQQLNGKLNARFTCDYADLEFSSNPFSPGEVTATLSLRDNIVQIPIEPTRGPIKLQEKAFLGLLIDPALATVAPASDPIKYAQNSDAQSTRELGAAADKARIKLFQNIDSELHSRGSFSLSCLTLVLFGAALGILLRGKNPLAVFVVGFVPAIVLVLLITAGRQVTEGNVRHVPAGIAMIWAGNAVLVLLVAGVYFKLLRR
jgi:lipopolysaccharide export LptBFGC system permease protein LptF